jgi:hypothetical protein
MVHRRELNGEVLVLGNQGALLGNAMTWWDHDTGSVWSQPLGQAVMGPRTGDRLELMAAQLTSWGTWKEDHPSTVALDAPGQESRFRLEGMTIVADFGEQAGVYPVWLLAEQGPANDVIAGVPISVVLDPTTPDRWRVFHRRVGDQILTLSISGDDLVDLETGSVWDPSNGRALSGPLDGEILDVLPGFTAFERDTRTFWPDAKVWEG